MTANPEELFYSKNHIWVMATGTACRIGITAFAQEQTGEIVYVDLPQEGADVVADTPFMEIESSKVIADIYAPVTGEILDVNRVLAEKPQLINKSPYGEGWLVAISMKHPEELEGLMNKADYETMIREGR